MMWVRCAGCVSLEFVHLYLRRNSEPGCCRWQRMPWMQSKHLGGTGLLAHPPPCDLLRVLQMAEDAVDRGVQFRAMEAAWWHLIVGTTYFLRSTAGSAGGGRLWGAMEAAWLHMIFVTTAYR